MTRRSATVLLEDSACGGSAHAIEEALRKVPGVSRAYVNPATEVAFVEYDGDRCTDADLVTAVESLGVRTIRPVAPALPTFTPSARYSMPDTTHHARIWWAFVGFLVIAGFLLITEHRAHLFGYWPFLILLACPLLHRFMHGGHGGHKDHDEHEGHAAHERHRGDGEANLKVDNLSRGSWGGQP